MAAVLALAVEAGMVQVGRCCYRAWDSYGYGGVSLGWPASWFGHGGSCRDGVCRRGGLGKEKLGSAWAGGSARELECAGIVAEKGRR